MDLTKKEKDSGIIFIADMNYGDFMKVIDAKIAELNETLKVYIAEVMEDTKSVHNITPHQIDVIIEMHKSYIASLRGTLEDLKEIGRKSLHKDYMVPSLIVETYVELARKVCTLKYIKLQPTYARMA